MAEVIRSGAFLQQCWSVHPLCLTVKRVEPDRIVVLTCSSCRMVHRVTADAVTRLDQKLPTVAVNLPKSDNEPPKAKAETSAKKK